MAPPSIHEIRIKGYKSLAEETKLEIRPLTILAGANSSGKSSVIQPLLLLKQTLASPSDPGVMELAGPNVQFTKYGQMFFQRPGSKESATSIKIGFSTGDIMNPELLDLTYTISGIGLLLEKQDVVTHLGRRKQPFQLTMGQLSPAQAALLPVGVSSINHRVDPTDSRPVVFWSKPSRGFLELLLGPYGDSSINFAIGSYGWDQTVRQQLLNLIHIPGLRGNPERHYPLRQTQGPRFDGHFQDYVAGVIAGWDGDERLTRLGDSLHHLGLTWKLEARRLDDTRVEIVVGRLRNSGRSGKDDTVNIADVGFGVSQILPALVAMEVAKPGQLIHLEQPEIHLHPKAQRNLAKLLGEAATQQKRLIVETHSSILIRGIQTLVAKGELDPKLVKLHWFTRDDETGATKVSSADLDENGAFGADWPEDFDDTYLESERDYLDAVEARMEA